MVSPSCYRPENQNKLRKRWLNQSGGLQKTRERRYNIIKLAFCLKTAATQKDLGTRVKPSLRTNRQSGFGIKSLVLAVAVLVVLFALSIPFYQNLHIKSLQAEAKVMLSYMSTLQAAYYTDSGRYLYFTDFYGAQIKGKENCERPEGAKDLGFLLRNCSKDPRAGGLRYAYKVEIVDDRADTYKATALSGSDLSGESFVCGDVDVFDTWSVDPSKEQVHEAFCE